MKYTAYVTVYHKISDIEAESIEDARLKAEEDYIWDDYIKESHIEVEREKVNEL